MSRLSAKGSHRLLPMLVGCLLLGWLLAGCSSLNSPAGPTPYPTDYIPTVIAMTVAAGQAATSLPEATATPAPASPTPQPTPSPTSPPAPTQAQPSASPTRRSSPTPSLTPTQSILFAAIQITSPGPMSRLVSPLALDAYVETVPSGSLRVELWAEPLRPGEEARLLLRQVINFVSNPLDYIYLSESYNFELTRVAELGQLRLSTYDTYGRPVSVAAVDVLLLSMGQSELNPAGDPLEPIFIQEPTPNKLIQGGSLLVSGWVRPIEAEYYLIELVAADGAVLGYRQLFPEATGSQQHESFSIDVPYQVSTPTWVRLTISESGTRIPGVRQLASVEVLLSP